MSNLDHQETAGEDGPGRRGQRATGARGSLPYLAVQVCDYFTWPIWMDGVWTDLEMVKPIHMPLGRCPGTRQTM